MPEPTKREQVLALIHGRLKAVEGAGSVKRVPTIAFTPGKLPAIVQVDGREDPVDSEIGCLRLRMEVVVVVIVRVDPAAYPAGDLDEALAPLVTEWQGKVVAALVAPPAALGGLASDLRYAGCEAAVPTRDGGVPEALLAMTFDVYRDESEVDPYAAP